MSNDYFCAISIIDRNEKSGYYIVKWTSESYNLQSSKKLGKYVINACNLVCDVVYLNPPANFKQQYNPYEDKKGGKCQAEYSYFN